MRRVGVDHAPTILESQIAAASRVNTSYRPKGCTGFVSLITMMTRCCCTRPSGKTERCLTLVTASMFAPARQRWRTTSRLPLFAARWSGVLPDCDAQRREEAAHVSAGHGESHAHNHSCSL